MSPFAHERQTWFPIRLWFSRFKPSSHIPLQNNHLLYWIGKQSSWHSLNVNEHDTFFVRIVLFGLSSSGGVAGSIRIFRILHLSTHPLIINDLNIQSHAYRFKMNRETLHLIVLFMDCTMFFFLSTRLHFQKCSCRALINPRCGRIDQALLDVLSSNASCHHSCKAH